MIILDTDAMSFLLRGSTDVSRKLRDRLSALSAEHEIVTSVVTYEEQTRGWMSTFARARSGNELVAAYSDLLKHLEVYKRISITAYSEEADVQFHELRRLKLKVGTRDLRIAAIAVANDAILITRNVRDFSKIPDLRLEDWTKI